MDCYRFSQLISDYIENSLTIADLKAAEAHLRVCPDCRAKAESLKQLIGSMNSLPVIPVSDSFETRLMKRVREESAHVPFRRRVSGAFSVHARGISAAAAVVLVMAGSMVVWRGNHPSYPAGPQSSDGMPAPAYSGVGALPSAPRKAAVQPRQQDLMTVKAPAGQDSLKNRPEDQPDQLYDRDFQGKIRLVNDRR